MRGWNCLTLPASGLERPLDVEFDRTGEAMSIVDFGVITTPRVRWRVVRDG